MSAYYKVPPGEAGAIAPEFSPSTLCDSSGRLLCVPERVLGVVLSGAHADTPQDIERKARRLQAIHHPDRPQGSELLSVLINVATQWVTTHLAAYQAWAASDEGAAQLARAVIICPAQLRPPLNAADERRILAELETGAGRQERLLKEREELQQLQRAATAREAAAVQTAEARQRELDAALREAEALRRRLATAEQRWRAGQRSMLARGAELATARQRAARLRWRLACSELMRRRQRGAMRAAVHAARTAEQVATAEVCRLRERGPPQPPAVLLAHLRRTAAGRGCSRDRRAARRFLDSL